jgi:2,3-diketo-5-methylthio-1-phosphopentane phosphatase
VNKDFKIFVDFDGTITKQDVGEMIFRKFSDPEKTNKIIIDYLAKTITAKECWIQLCKTTGVINKKDFDDYILSMEIDQSFHQLEKFCSSYHFELFILSDGFDYYIEKILKKQGLDQIKVYANSLMIDDKNILKPEFPFGDEKSLSSANCKWNHILNHSSEDDYTVFIGDGLSDNETVQYCDFVFAKDNLLRYCEMERITYFPFKTFSDVVQKLEELNTKKRLKKRHKAVIRRKHAYIQE